MSVLEFKYLGIWVVIWVFGVLGFDLRLWGGSHTAVLSSE